VIRPVPVSAAHVPASFGRFARVVTFRPLI
jgi:hypothetical protein